MPKYNTHEFVEKYYKDHGYILDSRYKNNKVKDSLICPKEHKIQISFGNFQQGYRCAKCSTKPEKLTHEYVEKYYKEFGYILYSDYIRNLIPDDLICPEGHKIKIAFGNFQQGVRCRECNILKMRLDKENVEKHYKEHGYILQTEYIGNKNKDELLCPIGHKVNISYDSFKRGTRCRECYLENNSGENHPRWNVDRTKSTRTSYLSFDHRKIKILSDDPNYNDFLNNKKLAKRNRKHRHDLRNIYEVDHIFPRAAFIDNDFDQKYDKTIIKSICNLRENLRIIPRTENSDKRAKYNQDDFITWFNLKLKDYTNENCQGNQSQSAYTEEAEKS